jgi:hypothetical protein
MRVKRTSESDRHTFQVNGAVGVGVDLVNHVLELTLAGVLTERAEKSAQLLGGDLTCSAFSSVSFCLKML